MKVKALLGKKEMTLVMYGVMICLSIAILFCIIKIALRPEEEVKVPEKIIEDAIEQEVLPPAPPIEIKEDKIVLDVHDRARIIEDNVNVRSGPGTDYERLGTAYRDFDFEMLDQDNDEWVKIKYDDKVAYVFAEYVEVVPMFLNDMGEYEEYVEVTN